MAVLTITGPTAAGKSTIERELQRLGCGRAISHTTRMPRLGEKNGVDYHFIFDQDYDRLRAEGEFIETIEFGARRYGLSKAALSQAMAAGQHVAIVVDPHGADQIHDFCHDNGLKCFGVWVDCDPVEQARRYIMRMTADLIMGKEAVGAHAERLGLMLSEEVQWRSEAAKGRIGPAPFGCWDYAMKVANSDAGHPSEIAKNILEAVA